MYMYMVLQATEEQKNIKHAMILRCVMCYSGCLQNEQWTKYETYVFLGLAHAFTGGN